MQDCDGLDRYVARLEAADDVGAANDDLRAHLEKCEHCRGELARLGRTAASVLVHHFDDHVDAPHLSDLELAVFVTHGLDAPNSDEAVRHLATCRECRQQFAHVRRIMEQHEDLIYGDPPRPHMPDRSFLDQVRLILSDPFRLLRALTGFLFWVLEWAMLVVVVFQIGVGCLANRDAVTRSAGTEFLGIAPHDPLRFWLIAVASIILAVFFRWLGAQLYHSAVEQER